MADTNAPGKNGAPGNNGAPGKNGVTGRAVGADIDNRSRAPSAVGLDVFVVVTFAAIGRRNHEETPGIAGLFDTAGPFLIGLALAWLLARAWVRPFSARTGIIVWAATVALGMLARRFLFDDGTATSFVIVAAVFLGAFLNGWRLAARRVTAD